MGVEVRAFRRDDRDQVAALVNAHVGAVVPGISISVNTLLAQLQRQPDEVVVDPWVVERETLVAQVRGSVVAAAHLLRYSAGDHVGEGYRDAGEIGWFVFRVGEAEAAEALMSACLVRTARWPVARLLSDPALPAPACYGLPEQWPHLRELYARAGFGKPKTEEILLADVADLPDAAVETVRTLGPMGTRFTVGAEYVELDLNLARAERVGRLGGWADVADLVSSRETLPGLLGAAAGWLRLAGVDRLLAYAEPGDESTPWLRALGFRALTTTERGWTRA